MNAIRALRQLVIGPTGQHRGARAGTVPARIEVPLVGLGPARPMFADAPAHCGVRPQAFRYCRPCGGDIPVVLHAGGAFRCDAGHITILTTEEG